jgi:hypothetical protein
VEALRWEVLPQQQEREVPLEYLLLQWPGSPPRPLQRL